MVRVNVRLYKIVQYFVILPQYPFKLEKSFHFYSEICQKTARYCTALANQMRANLSSCDIIGSRDLAHAQYFIFDIWFFDIIIESRHISLYKLCIMTCRNNCYVHLILTNFSNHNYIKEINVLVNTWFMLCYFSLVEDQPIAEDFTFAQLKENGGYFEK